MSQKIYLLSLFLAFAWNSGAVAQTPPVNGMRPSDVRWDAIEHATVFTSPLIKIDDATILMRNGWIEAVGPTANISIPAGATIHNGLGKTVMAGFIEPALILNSAALAKKVAGDAGAYWNSNVTPQVSTEDLPPISADVSQELRALGFTIAAAYPNSGIFRGSGAIVLLGMEPNGTRTIGSGAGQFVSFGRSPPMLVQKMMMKILGEFLHTQTQRWERLRFCGKHFSMQGGEHNPWMSGMHTQLETILL